jgi:hypothetical protein
VDLPLGELCAACAREIRTRAARAARWVSLATTAAFAVYVMAVLPPDRMPRLVAGVATVVWFLVTRRITERVVSEWLRSR